MVVGNRNIYLMIVIVSSLRLPVVQTIPNSSFLGRGSSSSPRHVSALVSLFPTLLS